MKSVIENETILIIKNSRFICRIYPLISIDDIQKYLDVTKKDYPLATHYCYAYIFDSVERSSDDGEPSGTAGVPILNVLEKNDLNRVLCIVVRYFGKIKLGAGGLIRAYSHSVTTCLKEHISTLREGYMVSITFPYSLSKTIDYMLLNCKILEKKFDDMIVYSALVSEDVRKELLGVSENVKVDILDKTFY